MTSHIPLAPGRWTVALLCVVAALGASPDDSKTGAPTAEDVLRRTADYYNRIKSFAIEVEREEKFGPRSVKNAVDVVIERPNKLMIHTKGAGPGIDVVSDGKTLTVALPIVKRFTQSKAPSSLSDMGGDPMNQGILMYSLQGTLLFELIAADPERVLTKLAQTSAYVSEEVLDGGKAHHLKYSEGQYELEIWIAAEGDPLLRKIATKSVIDSPRKELKGQKLEIVLTFKGWKINTALDETTFASRPPPGWQQADNLMEAFAGGSREAPSPLVGKLAPDLNLKLLEEGEFRLKDHRGKDIVVLDFWATSFGPSVQELTLLARVAESYKGKGVVFLAINQRETPEQIKKFQDDKKLKFTVALDTDGAVGTAYSAGSIPMLVLVDKKGVVQSVHVADNPEFRTTLVKELDALLAGKDLSREALDLAKAAASKKDELERVWSVHGMYLSVATDPKGRSIYAVQARGRCDVHDLDGKMTRSFQIEVEGHGITARVARQRGGSQGFLVFGHWGHAVAALKGDGTKLWEEAGGDGIDDAWPADLDGDGADEAIVGYNGATGLHVFSPEGKRLWKRTDFGNVWSVTAGDLDGDGKLEVVCTSNTQKVDVFAAKDGKPLMTLDPGVFPTKVRIAPGRAKPPSKGDLLLVVGSDPEQQGEALVALGGDGKVLWTTKLPASVSSCSALAVSPDGTRAALGFQGGRVCVVDVGSGRIVGPSQRAGVQPFGRVGRPRKGRGRPTARERRSRGQRIPREAGHRLTGKRPALIRPAGR